MEPPSFDDYPCGCPMHIHSPAHHNWGWPWLCIFPPSSPPLRLALAWELFLFLLLSPLLFFLLSGRPACWNPKWFRSKVIILLLFLRRLLPWNGPKWSALSKFEEGNVGLSSKVSFDFAGLGSPCSWAPLLFLLLDVALLHRWPPHLWDGHVYLLLSEDTTLSSSPFFFLHVLLLSPKFLLGGYCMHWGWLSRCLLNGCHWLCLCMPTFWTSFLQWSGWASLLAGEELLTGIWVSARCMSSSSVSRGFTKSWVGQIASRSPTNRHALDLSVQWTTKANRNVILYRVRGALSLICTFLVWDSRSTGSSLQARPGWLLFKLLCHRQSSLLACSSYPRLAPILTPLTFATYGVGLIC